MSPALIHGSVDRWLELHAAWVNASPERQALADAWHKIAVEYGAGHPAATGILLALVREAWGEPNAVTQRVTARGGTSETEPPRDPGVVFEDDGSWVMLRWAVNRGLGRHLDLLGGWWSNTTEHAALVAALESAPV